MKFAPLLCVGAVAAFLGGCTPSEDPIRKYKVEIVATPPKPPAVIDKGEEPAEVPMRYLAAIIPTEGGRSWFFKLTGSPDKLEPHAKDFRSFMESITFPKDGPRPLAWKMPAGWTEGQGSEMRLTTLWLPSEPNKLEMSVSLLGGELGPNINRWRGELGLRPISVANDAEFKENVTAIKVDGKSAYLMDMTGKRKPGSGMPKMPNFK